MSDKKWRTWEVLGLLFVLAAGNLLHFVYDWTGQSPVVGALAAVNESVWEHMKLLTTPWVLWSIAELVAVGRSGLPVTAARAAGLLAGLAAIPMLFYTYQGVLGRDLMWLDIAIFQIAVLLGFWVSWTVLRRRALAAPLWQVAGGAVLGAISGLLKSYCNVNEVISGIMLNWITLYLTNMLLTTVKEDTSPYTLVLSTTNPSALLPSLGIGALFDNNQYVGLALPLSLVMALLVWVVLGRTKFGYELKATGFNKNAAKYCGMAEKRNVILSLMISGALAGMGAALLYLTGYEQWQCATSSVPAMGFNGIAAAFLGGLNPLGTVLASFFIQHITAGGAYVDKTMYCAQISDLISAIIIYLCGFVLFMKYAMNASIAKREEKAIQRAKAAEADGKGGNQ